MRSLLGWISKETMPTKRRDNGVLYDATAQRPLREDVPGIEEPRPIGLLFDVRLQRHQFDHLQISKSANYKVRLVDGSVIGSQDTRYESAADRTNFRVEGASFGNPWPGLKVVEMGH